MSIIYKLTIINPNWDRPNLLGGHDRNDAVHNWPPSLASGDWLAQLKSKFEVCHAYNESTGKRITIYQKASDELVEIQSLIEKYKITDNDIKNELIGWCTTHNISMVETIIDQKGNSVFANRILT